MNQKTQLTIIIILAIALSGSWYYIMFLHEDIADLKEEVIAKENLISEENCADFLMSAGEFVVVEYDNVPTYCKEILEG